MRIKRYMYNNKINKHGDSPFALPRRFALGTFCAYMCFALCGCAETRVPESHDISVDHEGQTGAGISTGSTYAEWITAYDGVLIQQVTEDGLIPYTPDMEAVKNAESAAKTAAEAGNDESEAKTGTEGDESATDGVSATEDSPESTEKNADTTASGSTDATTSHDGTYMISAFYVDDAPVSVETLMSETGLSAEELNDHLADSEYLADHTVVYRYTMFTIENDVVTDITGDYLDYNQELN